MLWTWSLEFEVRLYLGDEKGYTNERLEAGKVLTHLVQ